MLKAKSISLKTKTVDFSYQGVRHHVLINLAYEIIFKGQKISTYEQEPYNFTEKTIEEIFNNTENLVLKIEDYEKIFLQNKAFKKDKEKWLIELSKTGNGNLNYTNNNIENKIIIEKYEEIKKDSDKVQKIINMGNNDNNIIRFQTEGEILLEYIVNKFVPGEKKFKRDLEILKRELKLEGKELKLEWNALKKEDYDRYFLTQLVMAYSINHDEFIEKLASIADFYENKIKMLGAYMSRTENRGRNDSNYQEKSKWNPIIKKIDGFDLTNDQMKVLDMHRSL